MSDNLNTLQHAIAELRNKQIELSAIPTHELTKDQMYIATTIPATLAIIRVTLKELQVTPEATSTTGYGHEIHLARAVVSSLLPSALPEPEDHPEEVDPD